MSQAIYLSVLEEPGKLRALPLDASIDSSQATFWVDILDPDGSADAADVGDLADWLGRVSAPPWLDAARFARSSEQGPGPGRRPAKIRVADGAFLARFYWVVPERLELDDFMRDVLSNASGRGEQRPLRQEIRALCGEGYLVTLRYLPSGADPEAAHAELAAILTDAPVMLHGHIAEASAMLSRFLDAALEDELDAIELYDELADDLQDHVLDAPSAGGKATVEPTPGRIAYTDEQIQKGVAVLRREVGVLRRLLIPYGELRELTQNPVPCVKPLLNEYVDLREGVLRVVEWIDTVRDLLTSTYEALLARQGNQMNLIMKKLSAWAAILLIPAVITGYYGMNFDGMPLRSIDYGWAIATVIMLGVCGGLYRVFRKSGWL